ncbi:MAG: hypothetical protein AAFR12_02210 [Cyanobacteria bacterium J06626_6]
MASCTSVLLLTKDNSRNALSVSTSQVNVMTALGSSKFPTSFSVDKVLQMQASVSLLARRCIFRLQELPKFCFSEIDQAFLVWGALAIAIFSLGQFSTLSWAVQAVLDAALTGVGIATTSGLTWKVASGAKLRWVIFLWAALMSVGTVATAYGIFFGSVLILSNLCLLWLGLCMAGYGAMAVGMRSRCFTAACVVHLSAIAYLDYVPSWQFFSSGLVMASTLFFFSVVSWDLRTFD